MTKNISAIRRSVNRRNTAASSKPRSRTHEDSGSQSDSGGDLYDGDKVRRSPKFFEKWTNEPDSSWAPGVSTAFKILVSLRMSAGIWSPLSDCDEVYNYWEPLHMLLYGSGFQTWEYSPVYAIRSYAYVWMHALPAKIFQLILPHTKVTTFFFLRCFLGFCCALTETYLYRMICERFGNSIGRLFVVFSGLGTGMFVASCAFLPSSFSMTLTALTLALWLDGRYFPAVFGVALSALVGWPFAALLGLPVALDMLLMRKKQWEFVIYAVISGCTVCAALVAIDSHFYGKLVLAPLNIVLYNVFTSHGPTLYGTEPLSYYLLNCLLNWNLVFALAVISLPLTVVVFCLVHDKHADWSKMTSFVLINLSMFVWISIFFSQPHKEERFLFPVYPLFCISASFALESVHCLLCRLLSSSSQSRRDETSLADVFVGAVLGTFVIISGSRTVALYKNYHAPFDAYMALNERLTQNMPENLPARQIHVCVGKEWYRYPSSFFLPENLQGNRSVELKFIKSEFGGLLPKQYERWKLTDSTRHIPAEMNDMNREEKSRYISVDTCDYLVDLENGKTSELEPNFSQMRQYWKVVHSDNFLVAEKSDRILRAFYVPFFSQFYCLYGRYNVLERPHYALEGQGL